MTRACTPEWKLGQIILPLGHASPWTVDKLQGALVVYGYERNVCIESIYKTLRKEGRRERE